jgi:hypothetical protein
LICEENEWTAHFNVVTTDLLTDGQINVESAINNCGEIYYLISINVLIATGSVVQFYNSDGNLAGTKDILGTGFFIAKYNDAGYLLIISDFIISSSNPNEFTTILRIDGCSTVYTLSVINEVPVGLNENVKPNKNIGKFRSDAIVGPVHFIFYNVFDPITLEIIVINIIYASYPTGNNGENEITVPVVSADLVCDNCTNSFVIGNFLSSAEQPYTVKFLFVDVSTSSSTLQTDHIWNLSSITTELGFVTRINEQGFYEWVNYFTGAELNNLHITDGSELYITGVFNIGSGLSFYNSNQNLSQVEVDKPGLSELHTFVSKLNKAGYYKWVSFTNNQNSLDFPTSIVTDTCCNVYVLLSINLSGESTTYYDSNGEINNEVNNNSALAGIMVGISKLDNLGIWQWNSYVTPNNNTTNLASGNIVSNKYKSLFFTVNVKGTSNGDTLTYTNRYTNFPITMTLSEGETNVDVGVLIKIQQDSTLDWSEVIYSTTGAETENTRVSIDNCGDFTISNGEFPHQGEGVKGKPKKLQVESNIYTQYLYYSPNEVGSAEVIGIVQSVDPDTGVANVKWGGNSISNIPLNPGESYYLECDRSGDIVLTNGKCNEDMCQPNRFVGVACDTNELYLQVGDPLCPEDCCECGDVENPNTDKSVFVFFGDNIDDIFHTVAIPGWANFAIIDAVGGGNGGDSVWVDNNFPNDSNSETVVANGGNSAGGMTNVVVPLVSLNSGESITLTVGRGGTGVGLTFSAGGAIFSPELTGTDTTVNVGTNGPQYVLGSGDNNGVTLNSVQIVASSSKNSNISLPFVSGAGHGDQDDIPPHINGYDSLFLGGTGSKQDTTGGDLIGHVIATGGGGSLFARGGDASLTFYTQTDPPTPTAVNSAGSGAYGSGGGSLALIAPENTGEREPPSGSSGFGGPGYVRIEFKK